MMVKEDVKIENLIYEIRGKQVMLDSDLAKLYGCINGTKTINQAVKRHQERFPNDFYFQLTEKENHHLRSQVGTTNNMGRSNPYVFTEQGVAMLASVLRTNIVSQTSVAIMRTFVTMQKYISHDLLEQKYINHMVLEHESEIKLLKETFDKMVDLKEEV